MKYMKRIELLLLNVDETTKVKREMQ